MAEKVKNIRVTNCHIKGITEGNDRLGPVSLYDVDDKPSALFAHNVFEIMDIGPLGDAEDRYPVYSVNDDADKVPFVFYNNIVLCRDDRIVMSRMMAARWGSVETANVFYCKRDNPKKYNKYLSDVRTGKYFRV